MKTAHWFSKGLKDTERDPLTTRARVDANDSRSPLRKQAL